MKSHVEIVPVTGLAVLAIVFHRFSPVLGFVAILVALLLPGAFLIQLSKMEPAKTAVAVIYSLALSILVLMAMGLILNGVLPLLGSKTPLSERNICIAMVFLVIALAGFALRQHRSPWTFPRHKPRKSWTIWAAFGLIPLMAALGADLTNNNGSNILSLAMFSLSGLAIIGLVAARKLVPEWAWGWAVFTLSLAILWSNSLRGLYITGHDNQLEYYVYSLTQSHASWSMAYFHDAYNACLSITILPTMLHGVSGWMGMLLYKVVYQVVFAAFTVGVFELARRYSQGAVAFLAAVVFITFPTYLTDMPMLNRQEIAFGFFICLLLALLDAERSNRSRRGLISLFSIGLILSHYSTTYVTIALLAGAYFVVLMWGWLVSRKGQEDLIRRSINLGLIALIAVATFLWSGVYTHTGGNIVRTAQTAAADLPALLHKATMSSSAPVQTNQQRLDALVASRRQSLLGVAAQQGGFSAATTTEVEIARPPTQPLTGLGRTLSKVGVSVVLIENVAKRGYAYMIEGLIMLGVILVVIRRKRWRLDANYVALTAVGTALLALETVSAQIDYGLTRMLQQDLVLLSLPIVLAFLSILRRLKLRSEGLRMVIVAAVFGVSLNFLSGVAPQILGGSQGRLPLSNSGFYFEAYYTDAPDMATYAWLTGNFAVGYPIHSDMFARMKILANTGITTVDGISPAELTKKSYVVLMGANVREGRVYLYLPTGDVVSYRYPQGFLDENKNLLMSTSGTRVYR